MAYYTVRNNVKLKERRMILLPGNMFQCKVHEPRTYRGIGGDGDAHGSSASDILER